MGKKEGLVYRHLKKIDDSDIFKFTRVETRTELGVPDINFTCPLYCGWMEAKDIEWPKRSETTIKIPFEPGQLNWINEYNRKSSREKSSAYLMVAVYPTKQIFGFPPDYIREEYSQEEFLNMGYEITDLPRLMFFLTLYA